MMNRLSVLDAVGFNPVLSDYKKMIHMIIKRKDLQPLLIGIDKELDALLEKELKHGTKLHKRKIH
jgi:hypothetical protein